MSRTSSTSSRAGFSLIELAIVMGIVGAMMAGIWTIANTMRAKQRVSQSAQAVSEIVLAVRSAYLGRAGLGATPTMNDDFPALMQRLVDGKIMPVQLLHTTATSCGGATTDFADSPLVGTGTACGSLRVCGWSLGASTGCNTPAIPSVIGLAQYFAIDFESLDPQGCLGLIARLGPSDPPALVDVYVNGQGLVNGGQTLPVPRDWAITQCAQAANQVAFVYRLRPPL